jgi:hypothetical protein
MTSQLAIPNPTGHPARFSGAIVDKLREVLLARAPIPYIFDPFAGTGERLAELLGDDFEGGGIELHNHFIVNRKLVKVGDATKAKCYPRRPFVVVTSPVYPNGMAESWNVSPGDTSTRNTYSGALAKLGGLPKPNDMGVFGYRGTKRDGRSLRRAAYWSLAGEAVACWTASPCTGIFLNVSDFLSGGVVEPLVQDWRALLREHGWKITHTYKVRTPRHKGNEHADQRLDYESILVAVRLAD